MLRLRCCAPKSSEVHGSWVRRHHRMASSSVISQTPKAHLWVLPESHNNSPAATQSIDMEHQRGIGSNLSSGLFNRRGVSPVMPKSFSAIGEALNTTSEPPEAFKSLQCWTSTDIPAESR
jgi:hypothetical protein